MLVICCPYCHEDRHEEELRYGGEADLVRPADPAQQSDEAWTNYLYMRTNTKGVHYEQWCCANGCGQWFKVARHTVSHAIIEIIRFEQNFADKRGDEA